MFECPSLDIYLKKYSGAVLRLGMIFVFLWFGISQITSPEKWVTYLPDFILGHGVSDMTFVLGNGVFEVVASICLFIGVGIRPIGALLALHLFGIAVLIGWTPVAIRDYGLSIATLAMAMNGADQCTLIHYFKKKSTL